VRRQADTLLGAPIEADVNDSYIQEMASTALAEVDRRSSELYRQKVVRIVNAQKQVNFINLYLPCKVSKKSEAVPLTGLGGL
jgi:hypothetical protein